MRSVKNITVCWIRMEIERIKRTQNHSPTEKQQTEDTFNKTEQ